LVFIRRRVDENVHRCSSLEIAFYCFLSMPTTSQVPEQWNL